MSSIRNPQWGNDAYALRMKQIESLKQYFPALKEITKDCLFEIPVVLPSRKTVLMRISLQRDFPYQPPSLQIVPQVSHKFVDPQMNVVPQVHEKLAVWSVHTNLGKTVYEVVQKFVQDPPQILGQLSATNLNGYSEMPPAYGNAANTTTNSNSTPVPSIPSSFPDLDNKTGEELNEMLSNEDLYKDFFDNLEGVKNMRQLRDELRDGNEELAKKNIARGQEIDDLRKLLQDKQEEVKQQRQELERKVQRQQQIMQQFSTPVLIQKLSDAANIADTESEQTATDFLNGDIADHKDFIKKFMDQRKIYHLRAAKRESLSMALPR